MADYVHHVRPTAMSSLVSGIHGRQRRHERNIEKIDLQRARRYGMAEYQANGRIRYTYGGIVFIYCPRTNREITSFPSSDSSGDTTGTKFVPPILLEKKSDYHDEHVIERHEETRIKVIQNLKGWKSHTVLVVDMSGSMRRDDVNGAKCRSDGIFMTLARDFVQQQLESRQATVEDLVSVVIMKETAEIVLLLEPMDWVLYNKLVDLREWSQVRPGGAGNYMPALEAAEGILAFNTKSSCSLSLMFFSDGRPSDKGNFADKVGQIASNYGLRLTVCCIGMASDTDNETFQTLMDMVSEADAYGAISSFNQPSMHADSLSNIITSMVTTLTCTKTEMTDIKTKSTKTVRNDVKRERRGTPDDVVLTEDWVAYRNSDDQHFVRRIWSWDYEKNDFLYLRDPRCIICYKNVILDSTHSPGIECTHCRACNICMRCDLEGHLANHFKSVECYNWLKDVRTGKLVDRKITSFAVAMKKPIFDEGAERMVHKFRYLDESDHFIGPKLVAKQSRFVELEGSYENRMNYHREFLRTQALAARFASYFNDAISDLVNHFDPAHHGWIAKMPQIHFLDPLVVEVLQDDGTELNILVEVQV
jgi:Mg-chelatase subunit ChlD